MILELIYNNLVFLGIAIRGGSIFLGRLKELIFGVSLVGSPILGLVSVTWFLKEELKGRSIVRLA